MKNKPALSPVVLAIDTSCDDTSAAVTCGLEIWSNVIASQTNLHRPYGGVFPTVAKQAHRENLAPTIATALRRAGVSWDNIDLIAVTQGPGLAPALEVGIAFARHLAAKYQKPLTAVNHLEGHILSGWAQREPKGKRLSVTDRKSRATTRFAQASSQIGLPALGVVISGKTTAFVLITKPRKTSVTSHSVKKQSAQPDSNSTVIDRLPRLDLTTHNSGMFHYKVIGQTLDDAAGEALDKIGRMVNLGYPAGPIIEELARAGNDKTFAWPLPMTHTKDYNLSFSGLKTHARNFIEQKWGTSPLSSTELADFTASLQYAVFRHICYKLNMILEDFSTPKSTLSDTPQIQQLWLGGGVAANTTLRRMLRKTAGSTIKLVSPHSTNLCTDNAAMIGICCAQ